MVAIGRPSRDMRGSISIQDGLHRVDDSERNIILFKVGNHLWITTIIGTQFSDPVRVAGKPHINDQIAMVRQPSR